MNVRIDSVTRACLHIIEALAEEKRAKSPIRETNKYSKSCLCCRRARPTGGQGATIYCMLHRKKLWPVIEEVYHYEKIFGEWKPTKIKRGRWLTCDAFEKSCDC